jgi:GAF domain-containing protein
MAPQIREQQVVAAFVRAADTLVVGYDMVDLLHTLVDDCAHILAVDAGGLMLADSTGQLELIASTSESADLVEVMQLNAGEGPCVDCFNTGLPVTVGDIAHSDDKWPAFQKAALSQGFRSVHATPMRLRGTVIGTINLFGRSVGELNAADIAVAQALADIATISILQERSVRDSDMLAAQLQRALQSRILVEQAKGAVAQLTSISPDQAFAVLRTFARNNNLALSVVCQGVIDRTLDIVGLTASTTLTPAGTSRGSGAVDTSAASIE